MDLEIRIENNRLETNLYIKPTNLQLYLDFFSNHHEPCKEGIVYGQALRIIERCSKPEDAQNHLDDLKTKLRERNYPEKVIEQKFSKAKKNVRSDLIFKNRRKNGKPDDKVRLIFTHNQGNPPLHQWMREAKKCLHKNAKAKALGDKIQIGFRQPKNLKKIVTQKKRNVEIEPQPGCYKCGKCKVSCPILKEGGSFKSTNTRRTYKVKQKLNCNSSFVIYLGTCKRCRGQYVGKTTQMFKNRHSGHKQEVKKKTGGLGGHYGGDRGCGYDNVSIQIIDQVEQGNHQALAEREIYWQNQLCCYVENGGNTHCYRHEK